MYTFQQNQLTLLVSVKIYFSTLYFLHPFYCNEKIYDYDGAVYPCSHNAPSENRVLFAVYDLGDAFQVSQEGQRSSQTLLSRPLYGQLDTMCKSLYVWTFSSLQSWPSRKKGYNISTFTWDGYYETGNIMRSTEFNILVLISFRSFYWSHGKV